MSPEQLETIQKSMNEQVDRSIKLYVNGKIDRLTDQLNTYIKEDNEWKVSANPTIELGNNVRGFGKVMTYLLGIGAAVFGLLKYLTK